MMEHDKHLEHSVIGVFLSNVKLEEVCSILGGGGPGSPPPGHVVQFSLRLGGIHRGIVSGLNRPGGGPPLPLLTSDVSP